MPINVSWYDGEKTIIQHEFAVEWTWDEFYEAIRQSIEMEKATENNVYVISVNPPNVKIHPGNAFQHFQKGFAMHLPNMRFVAVMSNNLMVVLFGRTLLRLGVVTSKTRMVQTVDEALSLIQADKAKLKAGA